MEFEQALDAIEREIDYIFNNESSFIRYMKLGDSVELYDITMHGSIIKVHTLHFEGQHCTYSVGIDEYFEWKRNLVNGG